MNSSTHLALVKAREVSDWNVMPPCAEEHARTPVEVSRKPFVLCLHAFSSSSAQFRSLMQRLESQYHVVAVDLFGHGESVPWHGKRRFTLADEAAPIEALLPDNEPVHLVGHSYGAAVALRIAAANRVRVKSMALYEPAIWGTLSHIYPNDRATQEIEAVRDDTLRLIDDGQLDSAGARFMDYWNGKDSWFAIKESKRIKLKNTVHSLRAVWDATFTERWSLSALRSLETPCLLMSGNQSTVAARRGVTILRNTLPAATAVEFDGLNHLGPMTHSELVNSAIDKFLRNVQES